jgi:hypothetical protein
MVENLGHFRGESIFKRASSAPDGERQCHDVVLLKSPAYFNSGDGTVSWMRFRNGPLSLKHASRQPILSLPASQ